MEKVRVRRGKGLWRALSRSVGARPASWRRANWIRAPWRGASWFRAPGRSASWRRRAGWRALVVAALVPLAMTLRMLPVLLVLAPGLPAVAQPDGARSPERGAIAAADTSAADDSPAPLRGAD